MIKIIIYIYLSILSFEFYLFLFLLLSWLVFLVYLTCTNIYSRQIRFLMLRLSTSQLKLKLLYFTRFNILLFPFLLNRTSTGDHNLYVLEGYFFRNRLLLIFFIFVIYYLSRFVHNFFQFIFQYAAKMG